MNSDFLQVRCSHGRGGQCALCYEKILLLQTKEDIKVPCEACHKWEVDNIKLQLKLKEKDLEITRLEGHVNMMEMSQKLLLSCLGDKLKKEEEK